MQPIPPRGPAELQPKRDPAATKLLGGSAGLQTLGTLPWLLPLPQGPTLFPWPSEGAPVVLDSHQPWAFGGFSPCVFGGVSLFLLFSRPLPLAALLPVSVATPAPGPQLPSQHGSSQGSNPETDPACHLAASAPLAGLMTGEVLSSVRPSSGLVGYMAVSPPCKDPAENKW